ncbi:Inosine/uridine-preferring nucleoside hydrolase [Kribbella flavida DSM 17836]|uniref:Inosine/uridine-preferring nucleoside hydrolase n=1 Tax=Kribbella flavida (strain DSM 17836 / JCM 10339 / NBRC 14399) TaxID=479435 RepID=D2PWS9_KRIFD|nr:nucleoside hydrolase [Kribbella flavida]ADB33548.1 Inosine/uridine-preferring nucleoside hydrolase [Kribbella flavida DSM 17836]
MATSVTLDTDIGTDVDDVLALATIFGSPELDLAAITTVYGDTLLRARMAARVTSVAGREPGPIVPGRAGPRSGREVWWPGHEGALLPELDLEKVTDADPIHLLATSPTVVAIGPLTNVAEAVELPGCTVEQLYLMGGDFSGSRTEHNVRCDIDAAAAVFATELPATVIGLEQTLRLQLGGAVVTEIGRAGPLGRLLAAEMRQFWKFTEQDSNVPHDPAAVLMVTDPELFTFVTGRIDVDPTGLTRFTPAATGPHRIVTDLDPRRVARRIVDRILTACEGELS